MNWLASVKLQLQRRSADISILDHLMSRILTWVMFLSTRVTTRLVVMIDALPRLTNPPFQELTAPRSVPLSLIARPPLLLRGVVSNGLTSWANSRIRRPVPTPTTPRGP